MLRHCLLAENSNEGTLELFINLKVSRSIKPSSTLVVSPIEVGVVGCLLEPWDKALG